MVAEFVKDRYNDSSWNIDKFAKPNGSFEHNVKNQLT